MLRQHFVSSRLLPLAIRFTQYKGLMYLSEIYRTVAEGIADGNTGPVAPAGLNLLPSICNVTASPRPDVVSLPFSGVKNDTDCPKGAKGHGCAPSIVNEAGWKLIFGWPSDDQLVQLPPLNASAVDYGLDGATIRNADIGRVSNGRAQEFNQATGPHWKQRGPGQNSTC